jgi:hypothetical protein
MRIPTWLRKLFALLKLGHDAGLYDESGSPRPRPYDGGLERPRDPRDKGRP